MEFYGGFGDQAIKLFGIIKKSVEMKMNVSAAYLMSELKRNISFIHRKAYIHGVLSRIRDIY